MSVSVTVTGLLEARARVSSKHAPVRAALSSLTAITLPDMIVARQQQQAASRNKRVLQAEIFEISHQLIEFHPKSDAVVVYRMRRLGSRINCTV